MARGYLLILITMFFLSWLVVILLVPPVIKLAKRYGLFDRPSARKVHQEPIPRTGGIALFLAFSVPFIFFYIGLCYKLHLPLFHILNKPDWLGLLAGGGIVFLTGLIDDVAGLTPGIKLVGQLFAALCACLGGLTITQVALPFGSSINLEWLAYPVTILWFLVIINGFNLLDGIDGLATTLAFVTGFLLLLFCLQNNREYLALPSVIIMGISLGFLHFNMHPACVFMGDSGSYFLGFQLAALAIKASTFEDGVSNLGIPFLVFAVPLMDVMMATIRRVVRGHGVFNPDTDHIHHCLLRKGFSQNGIILALGITTAVTGATGLILPYLPPPAGLFVLGIVLALIITGQVRVGYLSCFRESRSSRFPFSMVEYIKFMLILWRFRLRIHKVREYESLVPILVKVLRPLEPEFARLELLHRPHSLPDTFRGYGSAVNAIEIAKKSYVEKETDTSVTLSIPLILNNRLFGTFFIKKVSRVYGNSHSFVLWYAQKITHYLTSSLFRIYMEAERRELEVSTKDVYEEKAGAPGKKLVYVLIQAR